MKIKIPLPLLSIIFLSHSLQGMRPSSSGAIPPHPHAPASPSSSPAEVRYTLPNGMQVRKQISEEDLRKMHEQTTASQVFSLAKTACQYAWQAALVFLPIYVTYQLHNQPRTPTFTAGDEALAKMNMLRAKLNLGTLAEAEFYKRVKNKSEHASLISQVKSIDPQQDSEEIIQQIYNQYLFWKILLKKTTNSYEEQDRILTTHPA